MPKEYKCKICGAVVTEDQLKAHMQMHAKAKPGEPLSIFGVK